MASSRDTYNLPPTEQDVDDSTYNPRGNPNLDKAAFDPDIDTERHAVGARGADNEPTRVDFGKEDRLTAQSERTGTIPKGQFSCHRIPWKTDNGLLGNQPASDEVDDLVSGQRGDERNVGGRTRGKKVNAWAQERNVDKAIVENDIDDE